MTDTTTQKPLTTVVAIETAKEHLLQGLHLACASAMGQANRPALVHVRLIGEGSTLTIVGTDSYTLVEATIEGMELPHNFDILAPTRELKKAVAALRKDHSPILTFEIEPGRLIIANQIIATLTVGEDQDYPNYEQLFDQVKDRDENAPMTVVSVSVPALKLALEATKMTDQPVRFVTHPTDYVKPIKLIITPHIRCIVMPYRFTT